MDDTPFYLKGTDPNLITPKILGEFSKCNPRLAGLLENYQVELRTLDISYLHGFVAWILSQHISGRVAQLLFFRFNEIVGEVTPDNILSISKADYRKIGLSSQKIEYLRNLALFFKENELLDLSELSSDEIRRYFGQIKGIGRWTVNMFLIFNMGRLDVAAPGDLVVRKGLQIMYGLSQVPYLTEAERITERWGDYGTVGTILAWACMGE